MRAGLCSFTRIRGVCVGLMLLLWCVGCASSVAPTPLPPTTETPPERIALLRQPTLTPRLIEGVTTEPTLNTPSAPLATASPTQRPIPACGGPARCETATANAALLVTASQVPQLSPTLTAGTTTGTLVSTLTQTAPVLPLSGTPTLTDETIIGYSGEGRPLTARRFGTGDRVLLLVGGIHGGWESNTVRLANELIEHFTLNPQDVPPGVSVVIIPVANPDGLAHGRVWAGRLNTNSVDLNRNWSCNWSPNAYWQQSRVNPGASAMSEPETQVLSEYILQLQPRTVLFYHSSADGVFAGACGGDHGSAAMSALYGQAAGYRYGSPFSAYPVTGTASDWVDGQGIPAADVELITGYDSELGRNLRGVQALMQWLATAN